MEFEEIIFEGLRNTYFEHQELQFSFFDENIFNITEYLITVNICKSIHLWNKKNKYPYKIELEKKTFDFFRNCFDNHKRDGETIFSPTIFSIHEKGFKENIEKIRKGRLDIALSKNETNYKGSSEYIFEIKSINPQPSLLLKDFERIKRFLNTEIKGFKNYFKAGYLIFFIHHNNFKKIETKKELSDKKEQRLKRIKDKLEEICPNNISLKIQTDNIVHYGVEQLRLENGFDYNEESYKTLIFSSVIIKIETIANTV
ncbi:hypothetical protein [Polaribacter sp. NJDZ03]|uniref:hypothetical protein n=1 Tax=Polaribacter sp. NJDZ03 TaxID=2855841 RepID=UPI001C4A3AD0|nr:hypothetical protein [Polaribacter sp. NJDZ03]